VVMGLSPLLSLLDLVNSFPVGYMHAVLEGVVIIISLHIEYSCTYQKCIIKLQINIVGE